MFLPLLFFFPGLCLWWAFIVQKGYDVDVHRILVASVFLLGWMGYVQCYLAEKARLELVLESALLVTPPWQCVVKDEYDYDWVDQSDPVCIEHRARQSMSTWPNPLRVASEGLLACVDFFGRAVALFLGHQGLVLQAYLVAGAGVLVFLWPWICWLRSMAPRPWQHPARMPDWAARQTLTRRIRQSMQLEPVRLMSIEEVEDDTEKTIC